MLVRFTEFFLKNQKITLILIGIISIFGILSYVYLPKQYNPTIIAPAFTISVPTYGYSAKEGHEYIVKSLENKIRELVGVDKMYGYTTDGYAVVTVAFKVGTNQEEATVKLYDKIASNKDLEPYNIKNEDITIKSINPDDLPQVSYAITYTGGDMNVEEQGRYLQNIAKIFQENIKRVPGTTTIDIIGGYNNDISIELIPERIESFGLDIAQILSKLEKGFGKYQIGDIVTGKNKFSVLLDYNTDVLEKLKVFPISVNDKKTIYLEDVASITSGPIDITSRYEHVDKSGSHTAVFIGVAKLKGTNSIEVVKKIHETVSEVKQNLPKNIEITTIQDEGKDAESATNELLRHLFASIGIVFIVLIISLGIRNAINAAFCIPMVLGIVFITAYIGGYDVNRVTLFALILSLGLLVDDSIVMVENNDRHLAMMSSTGKTKEESILASVKEVGSSIVLSTLTRILAFVSMFVVTGLMGAYVRPIPTFSIFAMIASLLVAFSINPFLASVLHRARKGNSTTNHQEGKFMRWYEKILSLFINPKPKSKSLRKWLIVGFLISFLVVCISPVMMGILKARILPKADKNQVFLWVDAPRSVNIEETTTIAKDIETYLMGYKKLTGTGSGSGIISGEIKEHTYQRLLPEKLNFVTDVNVSIGDHFLDDFSSIFRGGNYRTGENQITMRINLVPKDERNMKSEDFVIALRPLLEKYINTKYPDVKMRLLEEPPGPPMQATLQMEMKGSSNVSEQELTRFSDVIEKQVRSIAQKNDVVDIVNTNSSAAPRFHIYLDHDRMAGLGLTESQVQGTLEAFFNKVSLSIARYEEGKYGARTINVSIGRENRQDISMLRSVFFTNPLGTRVYLSDISTIDTDFKNNDINSSDDGAEIKQIYAEIGNNSIVYPVLSLYHIFKSADFEKTGYKEISSTPLEITFMETNTGKKYIVKWSGEWKLSMETFSDLGYALALSLFTIFILVVVYFRSFIAGGLILVTFFLSFFGIFPGFTILYLISGTYLSATAILGVITLGGTVAGNSIILIDYINQLLREGKNVEYAVITGAKKRFAPIMLTSVSAVAGSFIIIKDAVWNGLAWSIIWGMSASAILTLFLIPILYYISLKRKD